MQLEAGPVGAVKLEEPSFNLYKMQLEVKYYIDVFSLYLCFNLYKMQLEAAQWNACKG